MLNEVLKLEANEIDIIKEEGLSWDFQQIYIILRAFLPRSFIVSLFVADKTRSKILVLNYTANFDAI